MPVLVEKAAPEAAPLVLSESAAILVHLAETRGALLPAAGEGRARVFEQLFFHASALSPAFGNAGFFKRLASTPQPPAEDRFATEARRVMALLDERLSHHAFTAGDDYSIADIAHFGWIWRHDFPGIALADTPHVHRWHARMLARPAVQRAIARIQALAAA